MYAVVLAAPASPTTSRVRVFPSSSVTKITPLAELGCCGIRGQSGGLRIPGVIKQFDYLRLQRGPYGQSLLNGLDALLLGRGRPRPREAELIAEPGNELSRRAPRFAFGLRPDLVRNTLRQRLALQYLHLILEIVFRRRVGNLRRNRGDGAQKLLVIETFELKRCACPKGEWCKPAHDQPAHQAGDRGYCNPHFPAP